MTAERGDDAEPRPRTLATQEIRLALAFTGGVSLAVWMGGVAREIDLLIQASGKRRVIGRVETDAATPDPATPDDNKVRRYYRRLLDLVDAEVAVDVLAGTSAGGINAALLGLVNAWKLDLAPLRDVWLREGDFALLLRDPREKAPPSLLKGDEQLLVGLSEGIATIIGGAEPPKPPRDTQVFIPTTYLSPETSALTDDYGTQITDADHHGLFHFDQTALVQPAIAARLALAARSSASFPGAFEPSFVRYGERTGQANATHPDMSTWSNATRSHWAADGGLLVNRPLAPLLRTVFDRGADREVRRALLYVVPSSGAPDPLPEDVETKPPGLAVALQRDLAAVLNQSIAADLAAIKEHNDRTRAAADTRLRLATLGTRLPSDEWLADAAAWADYRQRQGDWIISPLVSEVSRQLSAMGSACPASWLPKPNGANQADLRGTARETVTADWSGWPPADAADALRRAAALGRPAFDSAKATVLRLVRLGLILATNVDQRNFLAKLSMLTHGALPTVQQSDLREFVRTCLVKAAGVDPLPPLTTVVAELATDFAAAQGNKQELTEAWQAVDDILRTGTSRLADLVEATPRPPADGAGSLAARRWGAAQELSKYLQFLARGNAIAQLLDLHVAVRSVLPVLTEVQQRVELVQVSADTRTLLAPDLNEARRKLTGMQLHHFGAFYKASWRANDWMWGRLDGCGWLVHVLLDPRRLIAVLENDGVDCGMRRTCFLERLRRALDLPVGASVPTEIEEELEFLDAATTTLPDSLPNLALWVAAVLQERIAVEELPVVAAAVAGRALGEPPPPLPVEEERSGRGRSWLHRVEGANWSTASRATVADLLATCPVSTETLAREAEARTPLFLRTATKALAVTTSAATSVGTPPAPLRPTFATARTVTRTAYVAIDTTKGVHRWMALAGLGLIVVGVLALLTGVTLLGLTGLVSFGAGAVVLAFAVGRISIDALRILSAVILIGIAAAPWLPWVRARIFPWLQETAVPWLGNQAIPWIEKNPWVWPVVLFLVFLPPFTSLADLARRLSRRRRPVLHRPR